MKGKKIACFLALPHHTRFFLPILDEIRKHGSDLLFITPLAEYPYEMDFIKRGISYRYFTDYMNDSVRENIKVHSIELFDEWAKVCFKWEGFNRWPIFKQTWLLGETIEEYFCMERFIQIEKPDMFIAHHECSRWGKIIGHLCQKSGIPFVTFQEGDYYARTMGNAIHTEYSTADLLWGSVTKKRLAGYKCSEDKMFPIGNTHIDGAIKANSNPEMIACIKKELNIPSQKKVVLFLVSIKYGGTENMEIWQGLLGNLDTNDKNVAYIFKWHPSVHKKSIDARRETLKEIAPSAIFLDVYDPYRLIAISDYCISLGQTTLAIEAVAFGKPLFSVPDPDEPYDYYVNMGVSQTVYPLGYWKNLFDTMANGVPQEVQSRVDDFIRDSFYKLDGRTVERAVGVMNYIFDVISNKQADPIIVCEEYTAGRTSFVIPSGSDAEALIATLTSLSQNVKYRDWEVILAAQDGSMKEMLSGISGDIKIIEASGNLSHLYNAGAAIASGEYLIFMRPGTVYFKDEGMIDAMKEGITGVAIRNRDMTPYCMGIGFDFNFTPYFIKKELTPDMPPCNPTLAERSTLNASRDAVGGGLIGMHRKVFTALGGFDEGIANHLIEADICLKAKHSSIPISYLADALAFNYKETFFGDDISEEKWKNRVKFFAKWIGKLPKDDDFIKFAEDIMKV